MLVCGMLLLLILAATLAVRADGRAVRYGEAMNEAALFTIMTIAAYLFGLIIGLWILWAIIRGAVLSALRKHSDEQRQAQDRGARIV